MTRKPASDAKSGIPAPQASPAWQAFLTQAQALGCDLASTKWLLFCIGAHPQLISHAQILEKVRHQLSSAVVGQARNFCSKTWTDRAAEWQDILGKLARARSQLSAIPELKEYDLVPHGGLSAHPLMRKGVTIAPMPSALWSSHAFSASADPGEQEVVRRFEHLQAQLLVAYFETRARSGYRPDDFEQHEPDGSEFAAVPVGSNDVSRAVRLLSLAEHAKLVALLPIDDNPLAFWENLQKWPDQVQPLLPTEEAGSRIEHYVNSAANYFNSLRKTLNQELLEKLRRSSRTTGHDSKRPAIHGYLPGPAGLLVAGGGPVAGAEEQPSRPTGQVELTVNPPATGADSFARALSEGLAPTDAAAGTLELTDPEAIAGALSKLKFQQLALQMGAQDFVWDIDRLTPQQYAAILQEAVLCSKSRQLQSDPRLAQGAALAALVMWLGQPYEALADVELTPLRVPDGKCEAYALRSLLDSEHPCVRLVVQPAANHISAPTPLCFTVPAIEPDYSTVATDSGTSTPLRSPLGRTRTRNLVLTAGLAGAALSNYAHFVSKIRQGRVFQAEPVQSRESLEAFLKHARSTRNLPEEVNLSATKLASLLPGMIRHLTGEPTQAWLICRQTHRTSQARLYYTQHALKILAQTHWHSIRRLMYSDRRDGNSQFTVSYLPDGDLEEPTVGARFVARPEVVQKLLATAREQASKRPVAQSKSELVHMHNSYVTYALLVQYLTTGMRAVNSPTSVIAAWQQTAEVAPPGSDVFVGLQDKETYYNQRARLVWSPPLLVKQFEMLERHNAVTIQLTASHSPWSGLDKQARCLFVLSDKLEPLPITVAWFEQQLKRYGFDLPGNFARAYLRTELLKHGCPSASVDALLGHHDLVRYPHANHSTFDFDQHRRVLAKHLEAIWKELNLTELSSSLLLSGFSKSPRWRPPERSLALLGEAGTKRSFFARRKTGEQEQKPQRREPELTGLWKQVYDGATADDRDQIEKLRRVLRILARHGNRLAALLYDPPQQGPTSTDSTSQVPCTTADAENLHQFIVKLVLTSKKSRAYQVSCWLRLIMSARKRLQVLGWSTPTTWLVASVRQPTSPFLGSAVMGIAIVDLWRASLLQWLIDQADQAHDLPDAGGESSPKSGKYQVSRTTSPHDSATPTKEQQEAPSKGASVTRESVWACAILMSAVLYGGMLDRTMLARLCDRLSRRADDALRLAGSRAYLDFELPYNTRDDLQMHRWWPDTLTEIMWIRAPAIPEQFTLGKLLPVIRKILGATGVHYSLHPRSWGDLLQRSEIWWLSRASRVDIQAARRRFASTSVRHDRWRYLCDPHLLLAPKHLHSPKDSPTQARTEQGESALDAVARSSGPVPGQTGAPEQSSQQQRPDDENPEGDAREVDEKAVDGEPTATSDEDRFNQDKDLQVAREHQAALNAFHTWVESVGNAMQAVQPWQDGVLDQLLPIDANQAQQDLVKWANWMRSPDWKKLGPREAARQFTTTARALLAECGDQPLPFKDSQRMAGLASAVLDAARLSDATTRYLAPGLRALATFLEAEDLIDDVMEDHEELVHVDARILSIDEFEAIRQAVTKDASISDDERRVCNLVLTLAYRLGMRPKEVYGVRLCDLQDDTLQVVEYEGYTLKTNNARRRYPLQWLLTPKELNGINLRVENMRSRGTKPGTVLVQMASNGEPASRARIDKLIHKTMRRVVGDPGLRLYHCRHSFASWLNLALRSRLYPSVGDFFNHLPKTREWLYRTQQLAEDFLGADDLNGGRHAFVTARLVGHVGPAITYKHYSHLDDLVRSVVVTRANDRIAFTRWIQASGLARSTAYGKSGDAHDLVKQLRRLRGWVTKKEPHPADLGELTKFGDSGWISSKRVWEATQEPTEGTPLQERAHRQGLSVEEAQNMIERLKQLLPSISQPGKKAREAASLGILVRIPLSKESHSLLDRLEHTWAERWSKEPTAVAADLKMFLDHYNRTQRDFVFKEPLSLEAFVKVLTGLGITAQQVRLVLRLTAKDPCPPPAWSLAALGPYGTSAVHIVKPQVERSAEAYKRWLGIQINDPKGESVDQPMAQLAALLLAGMKRV